MTSVIEIKNTKICDFFQKHTHLNIENLTLQLIDMIENNIIQKDTPITTHNIFQINELKQSLALFKDAISNINKSILTSFLQYKLEYLEEFKTLIGANSISIFIENNNKYIQKIQHLIFSHVSEYILKTRYQVLYEKFMCVIKQFHKIINSNIETVFSKNDISSMYSEYIQNFEINSSHMIQTLQHHLNEFQNQKNDIVNKQIQELSSNAEGSVIYYSRLNYELNDFIHNMKKYNPHNTFEFKTLISQIFPTASTSTVESDSESNMLLLTRESPKPILLMNSFTIKDRNINNDEIKEFNKMVQNNGCHGILISQHTGITSKPNYYIDIHGKCITIYLHNVNNSPEKLQIASDIIDNIHSKLSDLHMTPEIKQTIPKEILDDINREYQTFISQRENLIHFMKETHKKMLAQVSDILFPSLDKYLSSRFSNYKKQGFVCDICNTFNVPTLKGLAAHKRGCNRKHNVSTVSCIEIKPNTPPIISQI
jgi:hypothetical protein